MFAGGVILPCLVATVYKRNLYHTKTPRLLRKRWGVPNFCQDWGGIFGDSLGNYTGTQGDLRILRVGCPGESA